MEDGGGSRGGNEDVATDVGGVGGRNEVGDVGTDDGAVDGKGGDVGRAGGSQTHLTRKDVESVVDTFFRGTGKSVPVTTGARSATIYRAEVRHPSVSHTGVTVGEIPKGGENARDRTAGWTSCPQRVRTIGGGSRQEWAYVKDTGPETEA